MAASGPGTVPIFVRRKWDCPFRSTSLLAATCLQLEGRHATSDQMMEGPKMDAETKRLAEDAHREKNWQRWGPYLAGRQWGTVREDYSPGRECWDYFPHSHARSRAYRWGEDGLLGITDRECRLCFALALWNGRDPILKERLFGLSMRRATMART